MAETEDHASAVPITDDLVAMLDLLAHTIVEALGFGVAVINIARPDGSLEVISVAGDDDARATLLGSVQDAGIWDEMLAESEHWGPLRFLDHRNAAGGDDLLSWVPDIEPIDADDAWHPEDALFAPLTTADGSRLGVLSVDLPSDGRRPGAGTRRALEAFAVSTALAIEHATLRQRAEASERLFRQLATHDQLTGLGNRTMLLERLRLAITARPVSDSTLALVFIDLDGFKVVNDRLSHATGDHVLQTVARRIRSVVRPDDTVVRWGGDEFLILLEDLDGETSGLDVVRRVSAAVAEPIDHLGHRLAVTASVGVVFQRPAEDVDADELVRRADAAMYQVKGAGRNAYAVFGSFDDPHDATFSR
jgi:diguanylate cyclase (GGDEF)-like protein